MNKHYRSLDECLRELFGCKVMKAALSLGTTCPNRDGRCGTGGCIFCAEGSATFASAPEMTVKEQLDSAIARLSGKLPHDRRVKYVAYFQSYTSTYLPAERLRSALDAAVSDERVAALSVATRPDCLPDDIMQVLAEAGEKKPTFVELGLQTAHEDTAELINRGYPLPCYDDAVKRLKDNGLMPVAHLIIGLPGEDKQRLIKTVRHVAEGGVQGVKLQLLHVLKGTPLEKEFVSGRYDPLGLEEYTDLLFAAIRSLPENIVIHRITGDGDKKLLVAPLWSADKKRALNYINRRMDEENLRQGSDL